MIGVDNSVPEGLIMPSVLWPFLEQTTNITWGGENRNGSEPLAPSTQGFIDLETPRNQGGCRAAVCNCNKGNSFLKSSLRKEVVCRRTNSKNAAKGEL
jgi:hypothetical protein